MAISASGRLRDSPVLPLIQDCKSIAAARLNSVNNVVMERDDAITLTVIWRYQRLPWRG